MSEQKLTIPIQSLKFLTKLEENLLKTISIMSHPYDGYITVADLLPPYNLVSITNSHSSSSLNAEDNDWHDYLPKFPGPVLSNRNQSSFDQTCPSDFSSPSSSTRQPTTIIDNNLIESI